MPKDWPTTERMTPTDLTTLLAELDAKVEQMTRPLALVVVKELGGNVRIDDAIEDAPFARMYQGEAEQLANATGIVALVNAYPRLREELAQTIETQRHMNTVLRPLVEELRKAAHQARGREIAAVAERDALRALIDKAGRHWLALDPGVPWEGAIDAAMEAACGEIQRLRALVAQQREALKAHGHQSLCGLLIGDGNLCQSCRAVLAQEVPRG